jgi:hypothetical protein
MGASPTLERAEISHSNEDKPRGRPDSSLRLLFAYVGARAGHKTYIRDMPLPIVARNFHAKIAAKVCARTRGLTALAASEAT